MQDKSANIEKALRNAISARQADTLAKRQVIYEAAESSLERLLGQDADARHVARVESLRTQLQTAINAIESDVSPEASASDHASVLPQSRNQAPMTNSTHESPKAPAAAPSRKWLPIAVVLVLAIAAGGGWFAYTASQAPSNVPPHARAAELLDDTYSTAVAKLNLDPQVVGFVDQMTVQDGHVFLRGWVVDRTNYAVPVSVLAYAGENLIGAAGGQGKRLDLKIPTDPDVAYKLGTASCPKGTALNVIGVTSDGRYASLKFFKMEAACPL
jgi:hypothetical protein